MKVLIYTRVSTKNGQDHQNQLTKLKKFCKQNNHVVYRSVVDKESGNKSDRKGFQEIFKHAVQGSFDLLLFWSLDRFSREGARQTITYLQQLEDVGVKFKSLTEPYIDSSGIFKDVIIALLSTLAKQEGVRIGERTKAGLDRAALNGRYPGRPALETGKKEKIRKMKKMGLSNRAIGKELGIHHLTVGKYG